MPKLMLNNDVDILFYFILFYFIAQLLRRVYNSQFNLGIKFTFCYKMKD